jgi:luciferase family oxidoreductase group 1
LTAFALNPNAATAVDSFPEQVRDLAAWVSNAPLPAGHPFEKIRAHPLGETSPDLWILGSSDYGARIAAYFGLPYAYAYFFTEGRGTDEALQLYRQNYQPSARYPEPIATICVWALAADTEEEARHQLTTREYWRIGFEKGVRAALVTPEEAAAYPYTEQERATIAKLRARALVGTPEQTADKLNEIARRFALDEIVIVTWSHDSATRHRSNELLADAFGLTKHSDRATTA